MGGVHKFYPQATVWGHQRTRGGGREERGRERFERRETEREKEIGVGEEKEIGGLG